MKAFLKRGWFKAVVCIRINIFWLIWYPRYYSRHREIKKILVFLNTIPSFSKRFPFINYPAYKEQSKYWIHWVRKMDQRERLHFKEWNPIILLNDKEWLHLDLSKPDVPIIDISFYWPDSEWISITIFKSLNEMKNYLSSNLVSARQLISMVNQIVSSETLARAKEKRKTINNKDDSFFIDENLEIVFSPDYLEKAQMKFKEYRKIHPKK